MCSWTIGKPVAAGTPGQFADMDCDFLCQMVEITVTPSLNSSMRMHSWTDTKKLSSSMHEIMNLLLGLQYFSFMFWCK